ncbi:hypothetical protein DH2020_002973 [Rehmannia glutinosa]|uniref:GTD-binding domain-containing protein n=1 Tax=Rehmannia glutinosa TaxID=99300 RepID=A0ABR0XV96_REHGL
MDLRRTPAKEPGQKVSVSITSALVSAVLEWMLLFMIFVDSSFSYLVTRFARYCQLQIPCLLCSRLDHVLGNERANFHWDLICHKHKLKISSLVLCQLHNNLVDVHGTCENCFFSFATINKSNAETYRLLVGKLGAEPYYGLAEGESSGTRKCMCCNEQWISRTCTQKLFHSKSIDSEGAEHGALSSITPKFNGNEVQGITEGSSQSGQMQKQDLTLLPDVEYTQVKVTSDTESESAFSDTENASALIREMEILGQDSPTKCVSPKPEIVTPADFLALEKLIHPTPPIKSSLSVSEDPTNPTHQTVESEALLGHGLEELNWQQADHNNDVSEPSDLKSFPEALPSADIDGTHSDESKDTNATSTTELQKEVHVECGEASNVQSDPAGTAESWREVNMEDGETSRVGYEIQMYSKPDKTNTSPQMAESLDLGDAYKIAVGTRSRQLSGRFLEQQRSMTDSTRISEDLKLLLSQISAARGIELSLNDMMSPRVSANSEDFKAMDPSSATGMQIFQRRISLERNESNLSLDGSTISEIEGESVVDRLKRQVEHDKKIMGTLYKELEEERNASAIAANQAMAMITRLQEEKAALNMEALQCLRMMEEQAEYDSEALQKANELLAEKEKQIQDFEYELELYRNQLGDVSFSNNFDKPMPESDASLLKTQKLEANCGGSNIIAVSNSDNDKCDIINRIDGASNMLDGDINMFEDEKQYVLQCLKTLEEKLFIFAKREENGATEKNHALMRKETSPKDLSENENSQNENEEYGKFRSSQNVCGDAELDAFRHELSVMNDRLEALEAEQNVIECSLNSLEKGSEGLEFVREIVVRLQELHSTHIRTRNEDLT